MFVSSLVCFGKITSPFIHLCMTVQYRSLFLYNGESPCYALIPTKPNSGQRLYLMVQVCLFIFWHQSHTTFVSLLFRTPMVGAESSLVALMSFFPEIDGCLDLQIILLCRFPYECGHFHKLRFYFRIEHCKDSELFPNCSHLSQIYFNSIKLNQFYMLS